MVDVTRTCDVLELRPFTVAGGDAAEGRWSCSRCGSEHDAGTSMVAVLRRRSDQHVLSMVVCPGCADTLG